MGRELNTRVVGMPSFLDPNRPETVSGSINFDLDKHPVKHAKEYAAGRETFESDADTTSASDPDTGLSEGGQLAPEGTGSDDNDKAEKDERDEWSREDWKTQAKKYDLPISGNKTTVMNRVKSYEADKAAERGDS